MQPRILGLLLALLFVQPVQAQNEKPLTSPDVSKTLQDILHKSLDRVPSGASPVSTAFTPTGEQLFLEPMLAKMRLTPDQKAQFRVYAGQLIKVVETIYQNNGLPKYDVGVAYSALLEMCYELNTETFHPDDSSPEARKKMLAAIRQFQKALGSAPAFQSLTAQEKQRDYEMGTFLIGHLLVTWQQAGQNKEKQDALRNMARQWMEGLYHFAPDSLARRDTGEFIRKESAVERVPSPSLKPSENPKKTQPASPAPALPSGPLPAARLNGVQVYIKYTITYFPAATTNFEPLLLYPDGTAFDDLPGKPVSRWDAETLRASLAAQHVGRWKQQGDTLTLQFPAQKLQRRVLSRDPKGWFDGAQEKKASGNYDIYFPVISVSGQTLAGEWRNKELTTMGSPGGAMPMVAAGSAGRLLFRSDGTFAMSAERFAGATNNNVGEAFGGEGKVGVYSNKKTGGVGRWRLDGLLLTREIEGKRTVHLLFALPNWGKKSEPPDLLMDGSRWVRPAK